MGGDGTTARIETLGVGAGLNGPCLQDASLRQRSHRNCLSKHKIRIDRQTECFYRNLE